MRFAWLLFASACAAHEPTRVFVAKADPPPPVPARFVPAPPSVADNCDDAIRDYEELVASGKGPSHPAVLAAKVVHDACMSDSPPPGMQRHKPPMPCGQAALERAALIASGKGPNHPRLLMVEARLRQCPSATPSIDECAAVAREHVELAVRGYGPGHPDVIANDAKRALCP